MIPTLGRNPLMPNSLKRLKACHPDRMTPHPPPADLVDLQVNGYAGVDFNRDGLTADDLHAACARLAADGVAGFLPTVITDSLPAMAARLRRIVELRERDDLARRMIRGLHIEGPFLNPTPGYIGAHPAEHARPAEVDSMDRLLEAAGGLTRIVTLAPECDPGLRVTRHLADAGVRVSAGHCDPSLDRLHAACDAGLSLFTHLGNGCPAVLPRHDNVIQRALSLSDRLTIMVIADAVHVPPPALTNYIRLIGVDRCVVVSDAVTAAGLGPGRFTLGRWELEVGEDLACRSPDGTHLVGSACPLRTAWDRLHTTFGLTPEEATRLCRENPRRVLNP